jgi:hypothetical protein
VFTSRPTVWFMELELCNCFQHPVTPTR